VLFLLAIHAATVAHAFLTLAPWRTARTVLPRGAASATAVTDVEVGAAAAIFARLADKIVLAPPTDDVAGDGSGCCRSGCEGCPWRYDLPPVQRSARPKWVATYLSRASNNEQGILESHEAKWASMFSGEETLDCATFVERVSSLKGASPIGPPGFIAPGTPIDSNAASALWRAAVAASTTSTLSASDFETFLRGRAIDEDTSGLLWDAFYPSCFLER
jgi:hypothetical protein